MGYDYSDYDYEDNSYVRSEDETTDLSGCTINITGTFTARALEKAVVEKAAGMIVKALGSQVHEKVEEALEERVNAAMESMVDKIFDDIIQPTDSYGKPIGEAQSLRDAMVEKAEKYLDETVDEKGNPANACSYGTKNSRAYHLFKEAADEVWGHRLDQAINNEIAALKKLWHENYSKRLMRKLVDALGADAIEKIVTGEQ